MLEISIGKNITYEIIMQENQISDVFRNMHYVKLGIIVIIIVL